MNAVEANKFSIAEYLIRSGYIESKRYNTYLMFQSPLRNEKEASFKVSLDKNLWIDYTLGRGGTLIDLILELNPHFSVAEAIREISKIGESDFSFQQQPPISRLPLSEKYSIEITSVQEITSDISLCQYLKDRKIDYRIASKYIKAVTYRYKSWSFKAIGSRNESGWNLRNEKFKGCTRQNVSLYTNRKTKLLIFEGIFDLLSYVMLFPEKEELSDYLVLNSVINFNRSIIFLKPYKEIELWLDNDYAGHEISRKYKELKINGKLVSRSAFFAPNKDLNEYLIIRH